MKLGVRNCEMFVSQKAKHKYTVWLRRRTWTTVWFCESVRMNSRVTKITIHCLLLQSRTLFCPARSRSSLSMRFIGVAPGCSNHSKKTLKQSTAFVRLILATSVCSASSSLYISYCGFSNAIFRSNSCVRNTSVQLLKNLHLFIFQ